ncbi:unnamed protein product [Caretta caretta]
MTHLSTTAETPAEISSNSPATTGFSTETTLPLSTTRTGDDTATLNPSKTESSTSYSSSPVSKSASQASEQTAPVGVSGQGSPVTNHARTEETASTPSATVMESSLGVTSTKAELSVVTSELSTQEEVTSSSNQRTLNDVTATDLSHSSVRSTAEMPSTDTEKSALPVSTVIPDSSTVAPTATSTVTTNSPSQTEVSQITGSSNSVPNTERVLIGSTRSDITDRESNTPPAFTEKVSSIASVASELGDESTASVGTNPMTHLSTTAETPAEISSNSPATTGFSTETTLPLSTTRTGKRANCSCRCQWAGSPVTSNVRTEETASTPSATVMESSLGVTSTKAELSVVTSELSTQEEVTSSSNQRTLNDVTATDLSHSSVRSTAEMPSTDTEKSALPVSTVIPDSSTVAPTATSTVTTNSPSQTEVSQITGSSNTVPNTEKVLIGSTRSDITDRESNTPPAFTEKVSSIASVASELGDESTASVGTNPMTHLSTTAETPAEISSNSPATTGFSTETTLPLSTTRTGDDTATLNPSKTESSTSYSSSPVSKSASQASEQTAPVGVSGQGSPVTNHARTEETASTPSATVMESSLGVTSTKAELSVVTSELSTQEEVTSSSNQRTLNDVSATDLSHSSVRSTAEMPSTDTEKSALPVSTVIPDSSTVAPTATSTVTTNSPSQTEVSQITGSSNSVPNTERVLIGSTRSDITDRESNTPPAFTEKVSSIASVASEVGDESTASVGTNPMTHLSTTAETPAEISSNSPATTGFSTETTLPLSTTRTGDDKATLNPSKTESSTFYSSSPVSKSASQASKQTAPVGVSGQGSPVTSNVRTEETASTPSATVMESSLGVTSTKAELSVVTSELSTQEEVTSSSNQRTLNDVTATDLSHSSVRSTAEMPSTDTEKSALPVSTVIPDSSTVAPTATSTVTTNSPSQTEVSQITGSSNTVPNTERVLIGSTRSDITDRESNTPPAFTEKVSSIASVASELGDESTASVGTNPMTHLSTTAETPAEISSNSPATTGFSTETTLPLSTTRTGDDKATLNPSKTESSTSYSSSPVSKSASQASEQTAPVGVSGQGSPVTNNARTEETASTPSATVMESSLGVTSTKAELSVVTSELSTQEEVTSSSNQRTLNDVSATDLSHSSVRSTAEMPSTDTEKSALPVSTVIPDSSTVAPTATSTVTTNSPSQTEVSQITGSSNSVPNTERVLIGSTRSDITDRESNTPPAFTEKVSSIASVASEVGDESTASVGTNPMTHLSTTAETPAEISSNSPATTGFSTETTLPLSTTRTGDDKATLNPSKTESSTSYSSSPVSKSASQASEQTAPVGVSGQGSPVTSNARTEETASTPSATVMESSLGVTSTKAELSVVTSELSTQEEVTSSSNQRTLNDVTATDLSHSSVRSTAEMPSTDTEKSALPVSTVIPDSSTVAPTATSTVTTNSPSQTEVSQITGSSNSVPNTERVLIGSTRSDITDRESNTPPAFTEKVSSTASVASELGDESTASVGTNPMTHLSTTAETPAEISSNSPATTGFSTETTLPLSTTRTGDDTATLNPSKTESSTSYSSSPVSKSASQASEQTASVGVSGQGSPVTSNARTEETASTHSATVMESSLGVTSTKAELSVVTSELSTQEEVTSSSNQRTLNDVSATDLSHSSVRSTAEMPSTDTEKSALPVSTVIPDSSTVAPTATSTVTTNSPSQTEVSQITGSSNSVPNTERVLIGSTRSDITDRESNTPPAFTEKVSSTASVASELGDESTASVGTNPMTHLSTTAETPAEISSNSPATTGFSTETTLPLSTTRTGDDTATLNPSKTESSTSYSSSPVSKSASQASEQTASVGVSGQGSPVTSNARTEETASTPSATVMESSLGVTSTKAELSVVTSELSTQEEVTSSSNQRTLNDVTATDLSHSSVRSTAEMPSTDTEKSALPVSTVIPDSSTVAPTATSTVTTNSPSQTEVSQITGSSNSVPNTERVLIGSTRSDITDRESNTPPAFTEKVSSTASVASELGDESTASVGTNPMTHLSTTAETPAEISSNSPATTGFSTETTLPLSTTRTGDDTATLNPSKTESSTSYSSSPVSKSASQASEQTAPVGVSGQGSLVTSNVRTEETASTPSATVMESSLGVTSTKAELSVVTSELSTQEEVTSSSNQRTLNDVTATDLSHSSVRSTAEMPSTDTEKSALPVSTVIPDSSTVAPTATSTVTTNSPSQTEVSQITGSSNTVPNTERVLIGSTRSDITDRESNTPPAFTEKVSSIASVASELGDESTASVGTNPMTHLSTTAETPAEISSNSPATTGFSTETTLPLSTTRTGDDTATLNPSKTESSTSYSSSPVSKSASQASEQTAPVGVSGQGSPVTSNARTEETASTPSATVMESSLGVTSTKAELSVVTSELSTQEEVTSSSNQRTLNDVTATDLSHSSVRSTAEMPSTDTEKSALPVSTVIPDSSTVAPTATSTVTTNSPSQTEVSQITGSSNSVPNTERVLIGSTRSDITDRESNTPPAFTEKVSSIASVASELGDESTASVGTNPMTHLSTTAETPAEISSNSPATTGFSTETTLPLSTRRTGDDTATLNPSKTESSTFYSSSPVSKSASQASEQTAPVGVSGQGSPVTSNVRTEETASTPSATVMESSLGVTSTKAELSVVTSELSTQEEVTSSSNQRTLNDVTATDLSHSSVRSTAEMPSTDTEKSALPVSTVIPDSSTVAPTATSTVTTNSPSQTEVSQITGSSNSVPNTERVLIGSTRSDITDRESNTPPAFTEKVSSTASVASELGDESTASVGTNPMTHLSTTAETPAEISSNSPATTGFSTETTLPLSTTRTGDDTATLNPSKTESSTFYSSSPVSKSASQASEQTAPVGVSGQGSPVTSNVRTEETASTPSATVMESSLGVTSTKAELSVVTSELSTQEEVTSSSNQRTLNDVTATDLSHSSVRSTAEMPSTDTEKSALPVSTVIPDSSTVAPTATSTVTTNSPSQTEVSQITGSSNSVPNTERVLIGSTRSDITDRESNTPPAFTEKVSSTASVASELGDESTASVGTNPMTHLSTTAETPAEISSNSPATTGFSTETTLPLSTTRTGDDTATLNPSKTESSTSYSSSPVSKSASQASEQTAPVGVSGQGSLVTSNVRTEETASTPSATVMESSLGVTSTKAELSVVTSELSTQEEVTSSSNQRTLNDVTATDLSHSSVRSTAEMPSTDTEKSALPVSTVIPDSSTVAPTATSTVTTNSPSQTEVSQITGSSNTVPNTEKSTHRQHT